MHLNNFTYTYYSNAALTQQLLNYQYVSHGGTYYIKATYNATGCSGKAAVQVNITAPPTPVTKGVNTFTPNGDGINDYFSVAFVGEVEFKSLKIFNRYGQLVFQTNSATAQWDGKIDGKVLPSGTYYWLLQGIETYDDTKISLGGYVTLLQ